VPGLNWQSVGEVRRDQTFDGHVDGHIYAQPLYWRPPGAERGLILAPTEDDLGLRWTRQPGALCGVPTSAMRFLVRRCPAAT
jgi:hypothetical protein